MQRTRVNEVADRGLLERLSARLHALEGLRDITAERITRLLETGSLVELAPGESLIREGDGAASEMYVLVDGALAVQSGGRRLARLDQPGDVVGEIALLMSSQRTADVVADSSARVIALPRELVSRADYSEMAAAFHRLLSRGVTSKLNDEWAEY